uniref:uncharacterized protein n=1 Tax=Semicossyphus pulcher TaxID=241346 RepID=UPI0037E841AE
MSSSSSECKGQDKVDQPTEDVTASEGDAVTLGCRFETSDKYPYLFWYKQEVNNFPKYILLRAAAGTDRNAPEFQEDRFDASINGTSVPLKIQKLQLSDSAVYYCALEPTMPLFISVLLAAVCLECRAQDNVEQPGGDVTAAEGETATLDCKYNSSQSGPSLFWYKQDGNNSPKFILSRIRGDEGNTPDEFKERFSSTLNSNSRSVPLKIQKLQLSDSAVYYCALR